MKGGFQKLRNTRRSGEEGGVKNSKKLCILIYEQPLYKENNIILKTWNLKNVLHNLRIHPNSLQNRKLSIPTKNSPIIFIKTQKQFEKKKRSFANNKTL